MKKTQETQTRPPRRRGWSLALATLLLGGWTVAARPFDQTHARFNRVLKTFVVHGRVDYRGLKAHPQALDQYLARGAMVSKKQFKTWTEPQQLAFLINLYNAGTLRLILNHYPVKSIKDIGSWLKGPWDQPILRLFGKTITLNHLEHEILRKDYKEPRIHLALVCAARGCPPLRSEAYTAERLDEQLNDQARSYLSSPAGFRLERGQGVVYISSIFKWYGGDFPSVSAFIGKYSGKKIAGLKIRYLDYDWTLNEKGR